MAHKRMFLRCTELVAVFTSEPRNERLAQRSRRRRIAVANRLHDVEQLSTDKRLSANCHSKHAHVKGPQCRITTQQCLAACVGAEHLSVSIHYPSSTSKSTAAI